MATLVLVRHGESQWNAQGRFQGQAGAGLTARGRAQALRCAGALALEYPLPAALIASDLARAVESARPAEQSWGMAAVTDPRWREVDVGSWSGLTHAEVAARDPDGLAAWRRHEDPAGDGETFAAVRLRIAAALADVWVAAGDGTAVVVTHGGPVRFAVTAVLALHSENLLAPVPNGSVTVVERTGCGPPRLVRYGHLPCPG